MSEPGAGSDVVSMQLRAEKRGDAYVLTGRKMWITNGPDADVLVVYAKTNPAAGSKGITAFIVERGFRGLLDARRNSTSSACAARTPVSWCSRTARCRPKMCSASSNGGVKVLMSGLDYERAVLAAGPLGIMAAVLDLVLPYVHERRQFGEPIGTFQLMQAKVADLYTNLNAARAFSYAVGRACDAGQCTRQDAAAAILFAAENATQGASMRCRFWAATATSTTTLPGACCAMPSSTKSAPARRKCAAC